MKKTYINDLILNIVIILICIAIPIAISTTSGGQKKAIISFDGSVEREISLSEDGVFCVHGVEVTVKNGKAFVSKSDCPDGLCLKMKKAQNVGDSIICVPNRVSVRIIGEDAKGADVVAG